MTSLQEVMKQIGNIKLYQRGDCIIIWYGVSYQVYWDYTQKECITHFKKKYGIKGKVDRTNFCHFLLT